MSEPEYNGVPLSWETNETIDFLNGNSGDEWVGVECAGMSASQLRTYVVDDLNAPPGLYESFEREKASLDDVDWYAVSFYLDDEDDSEGEIFEGVDEAEEEEDEAEIRKMWATQQILYAMDESPVYRDLIKGHGADFIKMVSHGGNLPRKTIESFEAKPYISMCHDVDWVLVALKAHGFPPPSSAK